MLVVMAPIRTKPEGNNLLADGWNVFDPSDDNMLEAWALFCVAVAGKSAKTTIRALNSFLSDRGNKSPFHYVDILESLGILEKELRKHRVGQYKKLVKAYTMLVMLNPSQLRTCSVEQLEAIPGIGPKTSRFFVQSTRENTRYAVLDTHVLAWLRELGHDVPKSTPTKKNYAKVEALYLQIADQLGLSPRDLDAQIWLSRAKI